MILRSVMKHVRDQNWFAVVLDFLIVVVGVFFGIQIGNWNDDRVLRQKAAVLEQRLIVEMANDLLVYRSRLVYFRDVQSNGEAVLADIEGPGTLSDEDFIIKAFRATQFNMHATSRYAFDAIVSTGVGDRVKDQALMRAAHRYYATSWVELAIRDTQASTYRRLFRETVPLDVQRDARLYCGDVNTPTPEVGSYEEAAALYRPDIVILDYPCNLSISAERITLAAKALREAEGFEVALRYRIAEMDNTNALIAAVDRIMTPWRVTPETFAKAGKERDTP